MWLHFFDNKNFQQYKKFNQKTCIRKVIFKFMLHKIYIVICICIISFLLYTQINKININNFFMYPYDTNLLNHPSKNQRNTSMLFIKRNPKEK